MDGAAASELDRMRESVFFDGPERARRLSRFWLLLVLSSTIAAAGVVADSTATVIGAMIVAPLMTPIQGTALASVTGDRANLGRCLFLVVAGAGVAVAIGWLLGLTTVSAIVADTNGEVAGRVHPTLIDLLAALATGAVGAVALARRDISDTLPGVAVAISLVPPLSVVGLTLESGASAEALGALLLFVTNVVAILATAIAVLAIYGFLRRGGANVALPPETGRRGALITIAAMLIVIGGALTVSSIGVAHDTELETEVHDVGEHWADDHGWHLVEVTTRDDGVVATFEGPLPEPGVDDLREQLVAQGVSPDDVEVKLVPARTIDLGG